MHFNIKKFTLKLYYIKNNNMALAINYKSSCDSQSITTALKFF